MERSHEMRSCDSLRDREEFPTRLLRADPPQSERRIRDQQENVEEK